MAARLAIRFPAQSAVRRTKIALRRCAAYKLDHIESFGAALRSRAWAGTALNEIIPGRRRLSTKKSSSHRRKTMEFGLCLPRSLREAVGDFHHPYSPSGEQECEDV